VVLEDSETLKVPKDEPSHGKIANIKDNSSSNNFMINSSHNSVINNNITVSNNSNSKNNIYGN
jgi:hypothetical protein